MPISPSLTTLVFLMTYFIAGSKVTISPVNVLRQRDHKFLHLPARLGWRTVIIVKYQREGQLLSFSVLHVTRVCSYTLNVTGLGPEVVVDRRIPAYVTHTALASRLRQGSIKYIFQRRF